MKAIGKLALVVVLAGCRPWAARADVELTKDGQARATIVLGEGASPQAREAAQDFQRIVQSISGARLPITTDAVPLHGVRILIGRSEAARRFEPNLPQGLSHNYDDEGYVIRCTGNTLLLAGNETPPYEGTYYAVYELLERLGCRWYFPGAFGELLPRKRTLAVGSMTVRAKPVFRVRDMSWSGFIASTPAQKADFDLWKRRNKLTQRSFFENCMLPEAKYLQAPVDGSFERLLPHEKYLAAHPEYYVLNGDGSRQPNLTSAPVVDAVADTIDRYFDANSQAYSFAFAPPDGQMSLNDSYLRNLHGGFDNEGWGQISDLYFGFMDKVRRRVAEKYPDRWLGSMAYSDHTRPPEGVPGKWPNVYIELADVYNCPLHGYGKAGCPLSEMYSKMGESWAKRTGGLILYEYDPFDWTKLQRPTWGSERIANSYRWLAGQHGWGFTVEGQMALLVTGLNPYLRSKLAWDVNTATEPLVKDFEQRFFGPAAAPMSSYYSLVEKTLWNSECHYSSQGQPNLGMAMSYWPAAVLNQADRLLKEAQRLAKAEPYRSRVAVFQAQLARLQAARAGYDAAARGDYDEAVMQAGRMVQIVKQVDNPLLLVDRAQIGGSLSGESLRGFYSTVRSRLDTASGRPIAVLPLTASFRIDPAQQGVVSQWYRPGLDLGGWRTLRLDSPWDAQGVHGLQVVPYAGIGWYRAQVDMPEIRKDEKLLMHFPGVSSNITDPNSLIWVWVNGELADHHATAENTDFDLTGHLHPGRNLIAIRIRNSGGLWLPPLIYGKAGQEAAPAQ